jgi:metallo-beta-lactamase class B
MSISTNALNAATKKTATTALSQFVVIAAAAALLISCLHAQAPPNGNQAPGPQVSVDGYTYTQLALFQRNIGGPDEQTTQFPPHKIIDNVYYVGTASLASFLVVTPQGNILIDSTYERNVPVIQKSVEQLGFKFTDIKILLGSHAHGDHMEGDALVKQLTGAQVMAMAEDVPALEKMTPGGKAHPIDKVLHDGDEVKLGGTTLVAHLTPGHTRGCTTWTMKAQENGKTYNVVIIGSLGVNPGVKLVNNTDVPQIVDEFTRAFKVSRSLPCDVPLGSHPGMYNMKQKYAKLAAGGANPYIDPQGYKTELDIDEAMFHAVLAQQQKAATPIP